MKKKVKKMLQWFYQETDRGEENISDCKSLYELVEKLQYRIEDLENEYMQMMCEMQKIYKLIGRENLNED
jgi:hypothetical protein